MRFSLAGMKTQFTYISIKFVTCTAIITLISVLTAGIFPFYYFNQNINNEMMQYNMQQLYYIRNITDSRIFRCAFSAMSDLLFAKEFSDNFYSSQQEPSLINYSYVNSVVKKLKKKAAINSDVISSISIYYQKKHIALSSVEGIHYENDSNLELPFDDDWIQLYNQNRGERNTLWLPARRIPFYNGSNDSGYVISLVSTYQNEGSSMLFCLNIDEVNIRRIMNEAADTFALNTEIVDKSGTIISDRDENRIGQRADEQVCEMLEKQESAKRISGINDDETVISLTKSSYTDWYYVLSVPSYTYFEKSNLAKKIVTLICIIIFLILLIISIIFSVKFTAPIKRIMSYIRDKKQNAKKARNKNELLYIEDVLLDLYSKSNLQEKTLIGNRELILYTFFLYLFSEKKIDHENVKTIMSYLDLQLKKPNFIIGLMQSKTLISEFEKKNKLKVIVKTFIEKNEQNEMKVLPLIIEDTQIVLIFNYNGENTDLVTSYITKFVKFAETEFEMLFVSSIGSICHNIEKIGVSYRNARSAILYSALYVQIEPYQYSITRNWDENGKFDFKLVNELVKDINEYKIDHCKQCLNFIMNNIINTHVSYKVYTKIIDTIENAIDVLCKNVKIDLSEIFSTTIAEQIESQYYIADVFHKIESVLTQIFHYIEIQHTNQYMTYVNKAKQFIDQNYNRDISIQDIADKLHITRNYLCRVFKDITSTTMLNYITEIRMKKAKELLQQRNFTVSEISSMVGFNNATYFAKKFKQHFGVTPYQFKINS